VQAHVRKIGAEARLEELTQPYIEWTAGPTQRLFRLRPAPLPRHIRAVALGLELLLLGGAFGADATDARQGEGGSLSVLGCRHAHDLICCSVGLTLQGVVHRADFELCLQPAQHRLVPDGLVRRLRTYRVSLRRSTRPLALRLRRGAR
jgi:hypothetical protein